MKQSPIFLAFGLVTLLASGAFAEKERTPVKAIPAKATAVTAKKASIKKCSKPAANKASKAKPACPPCEECP